MATIQDVYIVFVSPDLEELGSMTLGVVIPIPSAGDFIRIRSDEGSSKRWQISFRSFEYDVRGHLTVKLFLKE